MDRLLSTYLQYTGGIRDRMDRMYNVKEATIPRVAL